MFPEIVSHAQSYLYLISAAIIIILGGLVFGLLMKKLLLRIFEEIRFNQLTVKIRKNYNLELIISNSVSYLIYFISFIFAFDILRLKMMIIYFLILILIIFFVLSSLIGIKDFLPNIFGWFYLKHKKLVRFNYLVEIEEINGTVEKIGLIETIIKTEKGDLLHIPNSLFYRKKVVVKN